MKEHVIRLTKCMDLKKSISEYCINNSIESGVIVSSVGSLNKLVIRAAKALNVYELEKDLEILSLNGTVSKNRIHLHICCSDEDLVCYGGHLMDGTLINTTCELVILELDNYIFDKFYSPETKYNELKIINKRNKI